LGLARLGSGQHIEFEQLRVAYRFDCENASLAFGSYWLVTAARLRRPAQIFRTWLLKVAPGIQPHHGWMPRSTRR
jgi:hypothetical protein